MPTAVACAGNGDAGDEGADAGNGDEDADGDEVRQADVAIDGLSPRAGGKGGSANALPQLLPSPVSFPSLRENSISKEGGPAIARALRTNGTLKKLE